MSARSIRFVMLFSAWVAVAADETQAADYVFAPIGNSTRRDLPENWVPYGGPTSRDDHAVTSKQVAESGVRTETVAQIPEGFEVVWVTNNENLDDSWAEINNCGEIVFASYINDADQIRLYDNGRITQLTNDPGIAHQWPIINNAGTIVWQRGVDDFNLGDVVVWANGQESVVGYAVAPFINDVGQIVWRLRYETGCWGADADVFLYDEGELIQITDAFLSNQAARLNGSGEIVWTHYDFCAQPWESRTGYHDGEGQELLPTFQSTLQIPDINENGTIVAGGAGGIEVWNNGTTSLLTDWGYNPRINESGEIAFLRWHAENSTWQVWSYRGEKYYQITDDATWNASCSINDYGEIAMTHGRVNERVVRVLRRQRSGDANFDGIVGAADVAILAGCLTGPVGQERLCECRFLDVDEDMDVDLQDFGRIANALGDG